MMEQFVVPAIKIFYVKKYYIFYIYHKMIYWANLRLPALRDGIPHTMRHDGCMPCGLPFLPLHRETVKHTLS